MCKSSHALYKCHKFCNLTLQDRRAIVTQYNLCFNCIQEGHKACEFTNPHYCKRCKKHHHTLLHQNCKDQMSRASEIEENSTQSEETSSSPTKPKQGSYCSFKEQRASQILLARPQSRSQIHRVFSNLAEFYWTEAHKPLHSYCNCKRRRNEMPITGINNTCSAATHSMDIKFSSKDSKYSNVVTCFILTNLTGNMPSCHRHYNFEGTQEHYSSR